MTTTNPVLLTLFVSLAAAATGGCGDNQGHPDDNLGSITMDLTLAPTDARCAVITITTPAGSLSPRQLNLSPGQTALFNLSGLPLGTVTLSEQVFTVSCNATAGVSPTWASNSVTVTLVAGMPVNVTFDLLRVDGGGQVNVTSNFPTPPVVHEFAAGATNLVEIAVGPDDALWFTGNDTGVLVVGRITTAGAVTKFPVPSAAGQLRGIVTGPDSNLWFAEFGSNRIGRMSPSGVLAEFPVTTGSGPFDMAVGPDGRLWFTEFFGGQIGQITLGGTVTEFPIPSGACSGPVGITTGTDRNLWFTEDGANKIGRITTAGAVTEFAIPTANAALGMICTGPDGNMWFTEQNGNRIGRITPAGSIIEFPVPTRGSSPFGIAAGSDGNIWFVEDAGNQIGRLTLAGAGFGTIAEFGIPTPNPSPAGIVLGPDDSMWFTEFLGGNIGAFHP